MRSENRRGLDPGKQVDSFALCGVEVKEKKIFVLGAKRWLGRAYLEVEREIHLIDAKNPFDYYVVERNNTGEHVIEVLRSNYSLPIVPVTTVSKGTDEKRIFNPKLMDKIDMVRYMLIMFRDGRIVFPREPKGEVLELMRQLSIFSEKKTETGKVSYQAEGSEHDDLVMALMLACFMARNFVDKGGTNKYRSASRSFIGEEEDLLGTGVPYGMEAKSRYVVNP